MRINFDVFGRKSGTRLNLSASVRKKDKKKESKREAIKELELKKNDRRRDRTCDPLRSRM